MATLLGGLVDVSGSMERSVGDTSGRNERGEWARSIFNVVDSLIKHDVSANNHVFALGFGAEEEPTTFDLLNTIKNSKTNIPSVSGNKSKQEILECILGILESSGADRIRRWAKMNILLSVVEINDAKSFLDWLSHDRAFRKRFVYECLPKSCRYVESYTRKAVYSVGSFVLGETFQEYATEGSVRDVVRKGKDILSEMQPKISFAEICENSVMDVHRAQKILHGSISQEDLTNERVDELMELVRPYIYGGTPLIETLRAAKRLFSMHRFRDYNKLLFILSDGEPADGHDPPIEELSALGVKIVCCFITTDSIDEPKRLYSGEQGSWSCGAKFMFRLSSKITTQLIPRTVFVKRGWNIDIENNETRLFVQVNHPDIINDVCDLARDVVCCQDALSDVLSSVSLDLYINKANDGFVPKKQRGGTCYANASAAVLHLSMQRIVGREGGYPDFFELRREMTEKYGEHGANTLRVLQEICPRYRLQCKEVNSLGALKAITAKRPVLARFRLTDHEWDIFSAFYKRNPRGTLTDSVLKIRRPANNLSGHAVVLTSFDSQGLRLMNSWGSDWADGGFFRVSNAEVLGLEFVDVYWTTADLKPSEIDAYNTHGATIAQTLLAKLKGLQTAQYECPLCHGKSGLVEFSGHSLETTCPKCRGKFSIQNPGDDLALNLYILSLSGSDRRTS